jgi:DNA-binding transcriptional MocR family regulator
VAELLAKADSVDVEEDALYGKGKRGDELPGKFRDPKTRRANIENALRELEARKRAEAEKKRAKERQAGKKQSGRKTKPPSDKPDDKMKFPRVRTPGGAGLPGNFTDPESRNMKDGATKGFVQAYNSGRRRGPR